MRQIIPAAALLALAACAHTEPPINTLAAAEQALTAADQAILVYNSLPPCGPGSTPICSSPTVKASLKDASNKAFIAITAGRPVILANPNGGTAVEAAITDINAAIAALQAVVNQASKS